LTGPTRRASRTAWRGASNLREPAAVLLATLLLAIVVTWPVAIDVTSVITHGQHGGDPLGYLWDLWNHAGHGFSIYGEGLQRMVGAPFGRPISSSANGTILVSVLPGWLIAEATSPIVAYNVMIIAALTFTGASMYLLIRWLGLGPAAAAWAAVSFELLPYVLLRAAGHPPLVHLWCFPVLVIAGLGFVERRSWRQALWLALAFALCWVTNPYYGVMGAVMVVVFVAAAAIASWREGGGVWAGAVALGRFGALVVPMVIVPLGLLTLGNRGAASILHRNRSDLELYGAHLLDYLLPSTTDPLIGGFTGDHGWLRPGGERTVFAGWPALVLAAIGLVVAFRMRERLTRRLRLAVGCAVPIVVLGMWLSLASPYPILGHRLTMPSSLIYAVAPYLRAYGRFGVVVSTMLLVLGAVGLSRLLKRRSMNTKVAIGSVAIILAAINLPLGGPLSVGVPGAVGATAPSEVPIWRWLRDHERNEILLETPAGPNELHDRIFMYAQTIHGHRIANGALVEDNLATDFLATIDDPTVPGTVQRLSTVGIGLVAIEPWAWRDQGRTPPPPTPAPAGYRVLATFPDGSAVWKVTARPLPIIEILRQQGRWFFQPAGGTLWRYPQNGGRIALFAHTPGRYLIRFRVQRFRGWRGNLLRIGLPDGTSRAVAVGDTPSWVTVPVRLLHGAADLVLFGVGAPPIRVAPGDPRHVTVGLTPWTIEPTPAQ